MCIRDRRTTAPSSLLRGRWQGWCKQRKVQNMPKIWHMSYHATNSIHITDHLLSTLLSLRYMCYVAWKSRLTPAVLYWKAPAVSVSLSRQDGAAPRVRAHILAHFMVRLYIAVVCSYGEALADRIVSYRFPYGCIVPSLCVFLLRSRWASYFSELWRPIRPVNWNIPPHDPPTFNNSFCSLGRELAFLGSANAMTKDRYFTEYRYITLW